MTKVPRETWGSKTRLIIPSDYWGMVEDISLLAKDQDNPNVMSKSQHEGLWSSLQEFGWVIPLITDDAGKFSDGEQRQYVALGHGERYAPVLRLSLDDPRRRMLRQVLNKVRGKHDPQLDAEEFKRIMEADRDDDLRRMLALSEEDFNSTLRKLDGDSKPRESKRKDEEIDSKLVECPKCGYQFNPDNFRVTEPEADEEYEDIEAHIREGQDRGLEKDHHVVLDLSFSTQPSELTDRSMAVAEAFGIGVDESMRFPVFQKLELSYDDTDIIYVTGDSGSGKTTLLRLLGGHESARGRRVSDFDAVEVGLDETVIDGLGGGAEEAMGLLSAAGLSEAFLMLRRYGELSDGQRYRYRLAKMLSVDADVYLVDRVGENLDRVMARVLAYGLQKWVRRKGRMLVAASTHYDLITDLNPNTLIYKGFAEQAQIRYRSAVPREFSLVKEMRVEEGTLEDFNELEKYHYLGSKQLIAIKIFKLTYRGKTIGVVLYQSPHIALSLRNKVLPEYLKVDKKDRGRVVNEEIVRLSRIIVDPKYRGVGLAVKLVRETMPLTGKRVVETLAAMAKYNPFFEKAGMRRVGVVELSGSQKGILGMIEGLGSDPAMMHSPGHRRRFVEGLKEKDRKKLTDALVKELKGLSGQGEVGRNTGLRIVGEVAEGGLEALIENLIPTERVYLYWVNPLWRGAPD